MCVQVLMVVNISPVIWNASEVIAHLKHHYDQQPAKKSPLQLKPSANLNQP